MERPPGASGAAARHAVPRSTAMILSEGQIDTAPPHAGATQRFPPCALSLAPSLVKLGSEASRLGPTAAVMLLACGFATAEAGHRHNQLHRRTSASLVHPHKTGWPPTAVVARGTGREHRLSSVMVPDQPPGLAPEVLVERMRKSDLRRDGLATPRAAGAQRRVPLYSARAPPRWQEAQPDLTAPNAGGPVGAAARWTAPVARLVPRVDRSAAGRERASAARTACRDPRCTRASR